MGPTAAELAAIAAAYAVLAQRTGPAAPQRSRWRQAGRPGNAGHAFARGNGAISRWTRAGRAGD